MQNPVEFLNFEYQKRKQRNPNYSLRSFAKWLSISPAQLSQMLSGKRTITLKTLKKINDRLALSPQDNRELMQSLLKEKHLISTSPAQKTHLLKDDEFALIADWYHLAILSLAKTKGAKSDPRWVARRLGIKFEEAHQALLRMERLGILQLKPELKQMGDPLEVSSEIPSQAIRKYHLQNLSLAMEKIETVETSLRQFLSMSIPMNPSLLKAMKKEMDQFLERMTDLSHAAKPSEVYHLNIQLFPVSKETPE